jgi:hypothetical protein
VRFYQSNKTSKVLTDVFPDRDDWDRAILIDDDEVHVANNLGHGILAYLSAADFEAGLLHRILPLIEKCVEATREKRQQLGARIAERKAAAQQQEQQDLDKLARIVGAETMRRSQDAARTVLDAELNKENFQHVPSTYVELVSADDHKVNMFRAEYYNRMLQRCVVLPPQWSDFLQARVMPYPGWTNYAPGFMNPSMPPRRSRTKAESVFDLWTHDPVCRTVLSGEYGEEGYKQLLEKIRRECNAPVAPLQDYYGMYSDSRFKRRVPAAASRHLQDLLCS